MTNKPMNHGSGSNSHMGRNRDNNRPSSSSHSSRGYRGNGGSPTGTRKTNAQPSDSPHFMTRSRVVDRDTGGSDRAGRPPANLKKMASLTFRGNLAVATIDPSLRGSQVLRTQSAEVFPEGPAVRIIPLGGTSEVGMNMTAIECGEDIIIVDTGFGFGGGERFPGVDYIIPDTAYVEQNRHKIRGLIYTHGHLDHIGGAPYILPKLGPIPIFSMPLTLALLKNRLQEFELQDKFLAKVIDLDKTLRLGVFSVECFRLNHSIPDVVGLSIDTPMGRIVYCTDWKFDNTPFDNQISDYPKLARLGQEGVRLLLTDSLGVLKPGYSLSEKDIERTVLKIFSECKGRVIFTTFSTTVARIQHVINACQKYDRKLALSGRSLLNNFYACFQLGYIKVPPDLVVDLNQVNQYPPEKITILSTGSQGEDNAALNRMARDEHDLIKLQGGDSVIFSSNPIPGNEQAVQDLIALLSRKGVDVYMNKEFSLHVSGHANQEDLKLLFALTKPDYLQPIHGDHFMIKRVGELGTKMGIAAEHCLIGENGRITEMRATEVVITDEVITENYYLVDGSGVGAVSEVVLEERRLMSTQGALILILLVNKQKKLIGGPEIISRGFVYMKNTTELFDQIKLEVRQRFETADVDARSATYFSDLRNYLKKTTGEFVFEKTEKQPMIIPVVVQV